MDLSRISISKSTGRVMVTLNKNRPLIETKPNLYRNLNKTMRRLPNAHTHTHFAEKTNAYKTGAQPLSARYPFVGPMYPLNGSYTYVCGLALCNTIYPSWGLIYYVWGPVHQNT